MLVRASVTFCGAVSMCSGDVREINDSYILRDLLRAGYVKPEAQEAEVVEKPVENRKQPLKKPVENAKPKKAKKNIK